MQTGSADTTGRGVAELWGASGTLYFRTQTEFGRWDGTAAKMLITHTANNRIVISGMWGNSASEVFLAMSDSQYVHDACYGKYVVYYDGTQFHEFCA